MNGEKDRIRDAYRMRRAGMKKTLQLTKSAKICRHLSESNLFHSHDQILCYAALPEEADLTPIRTLCHETGKQIAFPRVYGEEILFFEIHPRDTLIEGTFHVPEPNPAGGTSPVSWENALCLTPGVVFDHYGHRYGYGRGFYDRYFAAHPHVTRCGIAFTEQIYGSPLPTEDTDHPVHHLLTEEGFLF